MRFPVFWSRIPKTASTAVHTRIHSDGREPRRFVRSELCMTETPSTLVFTCGHRTPRQVVENGYLDEDTLTDMFTISFVRNPWARWVSLWVGIGQEYRFASSFEEFVLRGLDEEISCSEEGTPICFTMKDWLTLDNYPIYISGLGGLVVKVERMKEDFPEIARILGIDQSPLPVLNWHNHPPYPEFHTEKTISAIADAEAWGIRRFGYQYGEDVKYEYLSRPEE